MRREESAPAGADQTGGRGCSQVAGHSRAVKNCYSVLKVLHFPPCAAIYFLHAVNHKRWSKKCDAFILSKNVMYAKFSSALEAHTLEARQ